MIGAMRQFQQVLPPHAKANVALVALSALTASSKALLVPAIDSSPGVARPCCFSLPMFGLGFFFFFFFAFSVVMFVIQNPCSVSLLFSGLKTQASFVFLPQKFCGNSAKLLRKSFVLSMGVQGCLLFVFLL